MTAQTIPEMTPASSPVASTALVEISTNPGSFSATLAQIAATVATFLGLGTASTHAASDFDPAGSAATAQAAAISTAEAASCQRASNLSDIASAATARSNLGLGTAATKNTGAAAGTVAAGDDVRFAGGAVALTDQASIATDASLGGFFTVTLGGNRTLANPTSLTAGLAYTWKLTQDGTGTRTLAFGSAFKWAGGSAGVLSTAAGSVDILTGISDGANVYVALAKAFA
jgi:hypothetical protein